MAPLVLLRDGRLLELPLLPAHVAVHRHRDRQGREVLVVLDATSERRLLASQPRSRTRSRTRRADGRRRQAPPLSDAA